MFHALSLCYFVTGIMIAVGVIWHMWSENRALILNALGIPMGLLGPLRKARSVRVLQVTEIVQLRVAA